MVLQVCFITQLQHISEVKCREWVIFKLPGCLTQDCAREVHFNGWPYKDSMLPAFSWKEIQRKHTPEPSDTHTHTHSMDKHTQLFACCTSCRLWLTGLQCHRARRQTLCQRSKCSEVKAFALHVLGPPP